MQAEHRPVCSSVPPLHPSLPALINAPLFCWAAPSSLLSLFEPYLQYLLTVLPLKNNTMGHPIAPRPNDSLLYFDLFPTSDKDLVSLFKGSTRLEETLHFPQDRKAKDNYDQSPHIHHIVSKTHLFDSSLLLSGFLLNC